MEKVYVFGHKNPDTDAVCGSIALAYLKNKLGMNCEPRILSAINPETAYVLKKFNVEVPRYLNDVRVQIKNVNYNHDYLINENRPIIEAFQFLNNKGITGIPLVDDDNKFKGYVSLKEIAAEMINSEVLSINTLFNNLLITLDAKDYLKFDEIIKANITGHDQDIMIIDKNITNLDKVIEIHPKLLIIAEGLFLSKDMRHELKDNKINFIITDFSKYKVLRTLCLSNPIKTIKRGQNTITFNKNDYLTDFEEVTSRYKHTNYPIINNNNICLGMLRTIDAHEVNKKKVILVDHNMVSQSVDGLYEAEIIEVIDHHNIGDINTSTPINFRTMSVGAVNTIIYYMYKENNIKIPSSIAALMLSGIISDTLLLQSPTTTQKDQLVASDLATIAGLDLESFGTELLESGVAIDGLTASEIIYKDCKTYKVGDNTMAIAQVFTTDINIFKPRYEELIHELNRIDGNHNYRVCALFITNFLTNNSNILFSEGSKKALEIAYGIEDIKEGALLKGVVSRKKQMIPDIMDVLEHM